MDAFKQYNTFQYRTGLETVVRELSKYHPLAIIEFIELYYNEKAALAYFNNDKCVEMMLDKFKRQLHKYKTTLGQAKTTYSRFTIEDAELIINKGYDAFTKVKLRGGRTRRLKGGDDICPICMEPLNEPGMGGVIHPDGCQHEGHSMCLREWWRMNPSCPICRQPSTLPAPPPPPPPPPPSMIDRAFIPFMMGLIGLAMNNSNMLNYQIEMGNIDMERYQAIILLLFALSFFRSIIDD
jgi:hypothetical protein